MGDTQLGTQGAAPFDRRTFLGGALALGASALAAGCGSSATITKASSTLPAGSDLGAVEHVVFLMQENRSFDHYFGSYPGVRGFDDRPAGGFGAFAQPYPTNTSRPPTGVQLPFRLDVSGGQGECTYDLDHSWLPQHLCRNGGSMDAFVKTHTSPEYEGPEYGVLTMGYHTRSDLPYHYALADAFTICDGYHCSIMGPTHPNRLMAMSGTIDPAGLHGGPVLITNPSPDARFSVNWTTVPELLEDAGVSWKTYTPPGSAYRIGNPEVMLISDAILPYFSQYSSPGSPLYQKAFLPTFPNDFAADVKAGSLPSVSWIIPPLGYDEHPPAPPNLGAWFIDQVLQTLISNAEVWSKTVLFVMYDENDGFFDHVPPPVAPAGTAGEYLTVSATALRCQRRGGPTRAGLPCADAGGLAVQPGRLRGIGRTGPHLPGALPRGAIRHPVLGTLRLAASHGGRPDLHLAHGIERRGCPTASVDLAGHGGGRGDAGVHGSGPGRNQRKPSGLSAAPDADDATAGARPRPPGPIMTV